MKEKVLALDLSTHRSGWAIEVNGKLEYGAIESASSDVEKRIGIMREGILNLLERYDVDTVVIEEVRPDGYNSRTGKVLTWLQGCIDVAIYEYNKKIKIVFIGPSSWRSVLGIQGYRIKREQQKLLDIKWVNNHFNLSLSNAQDDEADALAILASYSKNAAVLSSQKQKLGEIGSEESAF